MTESERELTHRELRAGRHSVYAFERWARDVIGLSKEQLAINDEGFYTDPETQKLDACYCDGWNAGRKYERDAAPPSPDGEKGEET